MKTGFFRTLARNNLRKNYRFFLPRVLSEAGLVGCFYISLTLATDKRLSQIQGGSYISTFMLMGVAVLMILSVVLMLYTNSFLMKQRKSEFGLYNVLGLEKKHVSKVMFHESTLCSIAAIAAGLGFGILFYKLCSLLICRLLEAEAITGMYFITPLSLILSGGFFLLLDAAIFLINRISIARMKPVELLGSRSAGEKEPRVKWVLLVLGLLALGGGYYISLTTESPLEAMLLFFAAVVLVMVGTYFLFVAGSVFVLKALRRNQSFYYTPRHMPMVSGLLYRMKQNAVGLASIALLATGVLVMISTTASLYAGLQGTLEDNYPHHLYLSEGIVSEEGIYTSVPTETLEAIVRDASEKNGLEIESVEENEYLLVSYVRMGNGFYSGSEAGEHVRTDQLANVLFITEETYEKLTGTALPLTGREMAVCRIASHTGTEIPEGEIVFHGVSYSVTETILRFPIKSQMALVSGIDAFGFVVSGQEVLDEINGNQHSAYGEYASEPESRICVRFSDPDKAGNVWKSMLKDMKASLVQEAQKAAPYREFHYTLDDCWSARESLLGMYGTLLFLGILLGMVCLFATALIIYFKQISEGYEDRGRFQIMEKIGMSKAEVRSTISSQVLFVFFLPLLTAGIHFLFAYPMLQRLLKILMLYKPTLFLTASLLTYAVFAAVYALIYVRTSRTYYKIVQ